MVGNVWEWCVSKSFKSYPYNVNEDEWAGGYQAGTVSQVLRGGSWSYNRYDARCAYRLWGYPSFWDNYFGFRLVSPI
jgi:formylglycine-generating enzyme required for sulfatase activity